MNKKMKPILANAAVLLCLCGSGCLGTPVGGVESVDPTDTREVIYISLFSGGFGTGWMDELIKEYNTTSENFRFKRVSDNKYSVEDITNRVKSRVNEADIYFCDTSDIGELVKGGYLQNLNDVWATEENGKTLDERVWDYDLFERAYSDTAGNLYAIPFTQGVNGVIYDHDLFIDMNLFAKDTSTANGLTVGMDGISGTYDDGLPATMKEFDELVQRLNRSSVIPFIYSGMYANDMLMPICDIVWAQYDGKTNYTNTLMFEGTYTSPSTGKTTVLTPETGYKVYTENLAEGKKKAIEFLNNYLVNSGLIADNEDLNHTDAEGRFILSHNETSIAMLFDGFWWEREASSYFEADVRKNGSEYGYGKRDFRIMPIPAYDGHSAESENKFYLPTNANGSVFAIKQNDEAKSRAIADFIANFTKSETLAKFSMYSSAMLPYDYEMTEEQLSQMTKFGQNYYEVIHSDNVEILRPDLIYSMCPIYSAFEAPERFNVSVNGSPYTRWYSALKDNGYETLTAALGKVYTEKSWKNMYDSIKDLYAEAD